MGKEQPMAPKPPEGETRHIDAGAPDLLADWVKKRTEGLPDLWTGKKICPIMKAPIAIVQADRLGNPDVANTKFNIGSFACIGAKCGYWDEDFKCCVDYRYKKEQSDLAGFHRLGDVHAK